MNRREHRVCVCVRRKKKQGKTHGDVQSSGEGRASACASNAQSPASPPGCVECANTVQCAHLSECAQVTTHTTHHDIHTTQHTTHNTTHNTLHKTDNDMHSTTQHNTACMCGAWALTVVRAFVLATAHCFVQSKKEFAW